MANVKEPFCGQQDIRLIVSSKNGSGILAHKKWKLPH